MSEEKKLSPYNQQKLVKPKIEDVIFEYLDGDMQKTALDFVAWLRANGMPPKWFRSCGWTVTYKGEKRFCDLWIHEVYNKTNDNPICNPPFWGISLKYLYKYYEYVVNEGLQSIVWDNVVYCVYNNGRTCKDRIPKRSCVGGRDLTILDKEFNGICQSRDIAQFYNPSEVVIKSIKKLLEVEKKAIDEKDIKNLKRPKQTIDRTLSEQKLTKPMIEDIIPVYLDGERKKIALNLAEFMRANKMNPGWYGQNRWKASNKGNGICFLVLESAPYEYKLPLTLRVRLDLTHMKKYEESIMSEGLQKIIWDSICRCGNCSGCAPGRDATILGKELKGLCRGLCVFKFNNPDEIMVNAMKRLLELEKNAKDA